MFFVAYLKQFVCVIIKVFYEVACLLWSLFCGKETFQGRAGLFNRYLIGLCGGETWQAMLILVALAEAICIYRS